MNRRWSPREFAWGIGLLVLVLAFWSQYQVQGAASSAPAVQVRTIVLRPDSVPVSAGALTGKLEKLRVTERVERKTGKVLGEASLKGILQLRNASTEQAIRPLAGSVEYIDGQGAGIALGKDQGNAKFTIYTDRRAGLKPGEHTSQVIDVPIPAVALEAHRLQAIHLHITYLSTPITTLTINGPALLGS